MDWDLAYTPYIWPSLCTSSLMLAMALYSAPRRNVPGATPFMVGSVFGALWAAGSVLEYAAIVPATKIFWVRFEASWQLPAVTAITCFALEYAQPGRWLTRRNLALLSIVPVLLLAFIWTLDRHHLMWRAFVVDGAVAAQLGVVGWAAVAYSFGLLILSITVFGWLFVHSPQHRWPVTIMITGHIGVRTMFMVDKILLIRSELPLDMLGLAFIDLLYAIALFGFRLFDPIPLARQTAIEQLRDGMIVLDPRGRVASLNRAAECILDIPASRAKNQPIQDLLSTCCPDEYQPLADGIQLEVNLPVRDNPGSGLRHYTLATSPLKDWRGLQVGGLLLLHDVTEQHRAQAQLLEQQKMLATLQERQRLARELHDDLGQTLGYISMQAQAIAKRAQDGGMYSIEGQLAQLADAARDAHREIRDSILNLKTGPGERWSFFSALRGHLASYEAHYGIRAELSIPEGLTEDDLGPGIGVQLLRVIQEALTNARKHGQARRVKVSFSAENSSVQIMVADDGCGFDPQQAPQAGGDHLGLAFMRDRMAQVGGRIGIDSVPGAGTRVRLSVPFGRAQKEAAA